jgi:hypothetical protein
VSKGFNFELSKLRLGTVPYSAKNRQALDIAQGIPKDYFLHSFVMRLQYRFALSAGTTSGTIFSEIGANLIEQCEISGNHKVYGDLVRTRLQGSHLYVLGCIRGGGLHERTINVGGVVTQLAPTGLNNIYTNTAAISGAVATNDISTTIVYHLAPPRLRPQEQLLYLLDPPFWNSLNLYIDWGDATNLVNGGDRTAALTGYGGAGGTPQLVIWRIIAKLKGDRYKVNPIPVKETYLSINATISQTDTLVTNVNIGNFVRSINLVTGTLSGAGLAKVGDNFLTLQGAAGSNAQGAQGANSSNTPFYTRVKVKKDDIVTRDMEYIPLQEYELDEKDIGSLPFPIGYNTIEFVEGIGPENTVGTSFDTRQIALQNLKLTLEGDLTGAANQKIHVIHTELAGVPVYQSASGD